VTDRPPLDARDAWGALVLGVAPRQPPDALRARIFAAADRAAPYRRFLAPFARCFDLSDGPLHALLARMDDPAAWTAGLREVVAFLHFDAGPGLRTEAGTPHCGIARMRTGARIPAHRHTAREITFVLRGTLSDDRGRIFEPGDVLDMPPGSSHALAIAGEEDALVAVLLSGIEVASPA
jgi:putative transcriptional regulator